MSGLRPKFEQCLNNDASKSSFANTTFLIILMEGNERRHLTRARTFDTGLSEILWEPIWEKRFKASERQL